MVILKMKVGPKGQVVIPKPVRDDCSIHPGDEVLIDHHYGLITIRKKTRDLKEFLESIPRKGKSTFKKEMLYEQAEERWKRAQHT